MFDTLFPQLWSRWLIDEWRRSTANETCYGDYVLVKKLDERIFPTERIEFIISRLSVFFRLTYDSTVTWPHLYMPGHCMIVGLEACGYRDAIGDWTRDRRETFDRFEMISFHSADWSKIDKQQCGLKSKRIPEERRGCKGGCAVRFDEGLPHMYEWVAQCSARALLPIRQTPLALLRSSCAGQSLANKDATLCYR